MSGRGRGGDDGRRRQLGCSQRCEAALLRVLPKRVVRGGWLRLRRITGGLRQRAAAVPVRRASSGWEVMLISSSKQPGVWILPGGGVDHGECPAEAAKRELLEEAGVSGRLVWRAGSFRCDTRLTETHLWAMAPEAFAPSWEEHTFRQRRWFPTEEVHEVLKKEHQGQLRELLAQLPEHEHHFS
eukprot:TRINITY_DN5154_c0_g1_i1.p2 TRINITY_DN5154_c0_g1~~TRINITY_DN5154_c0_g1_i1.p2  ORF type:complete len:207 (+),score=72.00 TRINITY_DN5154_c0_g1_i1:71-622(+)